MQIADAVVVITGASSGNGRAAAHAFARQGARLVLTARRSQALADAAQECEELGGHAVVAPADVTDSGQLDAVAALALRAHGRIDVWVNCAGVMHFGRFDETPQEVVEQVIRTNLFGYFNGARCALRHFRGRKQGILIQVGSILGLMGHPYTAAYGASKFAINGLTASLRQELQDYPAIHVCAVLPAAIDTPIYQRAANYTGRATQPIRPIYAPDVVARQIVSLAKRPRRRAYAGGFARLTAAGNLVAPATTERLVRVAADALEVRPQPAAAANGNVFQPVSDGYATDGGWRKRRRRKAASLAMPLLAAAGLLGAGAVAFLASQRTRSRTQSDLSTC